MNQWWADYSKYLNSKEWKDFRTRYFTLHPKRCRICRSERGVALHHTQYNNYKSKDFSLYVPLCSLHHDMLTKEYRSKGRRTTMPLDQFTVYFVGRERSKRKPTNS